MHGRLVKGDMTAEKQHEAISRSYIQEVCERLAADKPVRRPLPGGGFLNIDRELPFLCVYRRDPRSRDEGTLSFVSHEAAYLSAPGEAPVRKGLTTLIQSIGDQAATRFGAFLILEIRGTTESDPGKLEVPPRGEPNLPCPKFRVHSESARHSAETVNALRFGLEQIRLFRQSAVVDVHLGSGSHPPGLKRLVPQRRSAESPCFLVGLEISPVYRDAESGAIYPAVLKELRRKVSKALKRALFAFAIHHTRLRPHHYYSLGRSRIANSVWDVDKQLADIRRQFDMLFLVTPFNAKSSWEAFQDADFRTSPSFQYRPLPFDPWVMKRALTEIPVEQIDDPTLAHIFRATQDELDRQLTMLVDIGSERFRYGSVQVYGRVERNLITQARTILRTLPRGVESDADEDRCGAEVLARRARTEISRYRELDPSFSASVEVREDIYSGLLVSGGRLLVGQEASVLPGRVAALLAHEVGTHLVTRHNGERQPMQLLQSGLAGYDPLQEGLAVLAEYLVGGLTPSRLRLLAARVVAADATLRGVRFDEVFALLTDTHGFAPQTAYTITLRTFRGGGFTKDAAYLRGLNQVIQYLKAGGDLEPLYIGKVSLDHVPLIRELLLRDVLQPPAVLPRFLEKDTAKERLETVRTFSTVVDLAKALPP